MDAIKEFEGKYRFLSNFWEHEITYDGLTFNSVEAAYQAQKAMTHIIRREFTSLTPGQAKRKGKNIQCREHWDSIKTDIMYNLVRQKFSGNPWLREKLLETGDAHLEEGNWWNDTFWGVCKGVGENNLGKILMKVRQELRDEV